MNAFEIVTPLTVCIPTIESRRSLLSRCLWSLPADVEVIVADGEWPMGDKLNACFQAATRDFVVCVDDDDMLIGEWHDVASGGDSINYIGYKILYTEDGKFAGSVTHRGNGDTTWATFDRGVSPKCLVRTEIARAHKFGNHYTADREWSEAVQADIADDLGSHAFVDAHLYHYDHWNSHMVGTTPDAGRLHTPQRDVGIWPYDPKAVTWLAL